MIASLSPGLVSGLPPSPSIPALSAGVWSPSCASVSLSASLSASICPPPIIRVCRSARAPVPCAPSPASLGPCDANGEARAVNRHGTSPLVKRSVSRGSARVQLILQWLRKPEYWSEGSSGTQALWHAYTPEPVTPSELALSRQACGVACDAQPVIKGTLPNRDIAHMAATSLGYLTWGVTNDPMDYGLGDLGGWALDLLQIWGSYLANAPKEDLASWLHAHLGEQDARMGFSYSDVLADCDAWLLARSMQSNSSERSLSTAMRDMFAQSETNRIKRFYQSRFKGSADNLVIASRKLVDGIDLGIFDNVSGSKKALLIASHADRLPSQAEAGILALSYAESLENPNR